MAPKRRKPVPAQKPGVLKPSQRFIHQRTGKLSKTNLHALFTSPDLWNALTASQQAQALSHLDIPSLFGSSHPKNSSDSVVKGKGKEKEKYLNYFTEPNPASTEADVYFDLTTHLERFREHLVEGRFEAKWMRESEEIRLKREAGAFEGIWEAENVGLDEEGRKRVEEVKRRRMARKERGEE
jgi:hypothetical protein